MKTPAILALEDGTVFHGQSVGAQGSAIGEVCFNTSMTGYQEICTDPSYHRQLVTLTYPHIGNVGTTPIDSESDAPKLAGLIVRDIPSRASSWRSRESLPEFLGRRGVVAISGIDTRMLTRRLREHGAQNGCLVAGDGDAENATARAREFPGLKGMDLAQAVSTSQPYEWRLGSWSIDAEEREPEPADPASLPYRVVAYDYGVKRNILRRLVDHGAAVTVVPARTPAHEVLALRPDGVFLSNGPGDPEPCDYAIGASRQFIEAGLPLFGICLGHQILGLAVGARSIKMKFGHHGANHPVLDVDTGRVMISSQNHGFALEEDSLPPSVRATHRSLFDGSLQGIAVCDRPAFSFQGHPEASPGPHDVAPLFRRFAELMAVRRGSPSSAR